MEKDLPNITAVIFDMDGTLIDTERIGAASWDFAGEELGLRVEASVKQRMIGRTLPDIRELVAEALPGEDVDGLLERANFHYHRLISEATPPVKPGARELLEWLRERSVPMALATSSRRFQAEDKLGRTELRDFFHFLIAGDEIQRGKPDPEIFVRAASGLGVSPSQCAVFEDSLPGLEAAHRAGTRVIWVPDEPATAAVPVHADCVMEDLHQAPAWLAARMG